MFVATRVQNSHVDLLEEDVGVGLLLATQVLGLVSRGLGGGATTGRRGDNREEG